MANVAGLLAGYKEQGHRRKRKSLNEQTTDSSVFARRAEVDFGRMEGSNGSLPLSDNQSAYSGMLAHDAIEDEAG